MSDKHLDQPDEIECPVADCDNGKRWIMEGDEGCWEPCEHPCHDTKEERREAYYDRFGA